MNDGECDEVMYCPAGTDRTDCCPVGGTPITEGKLCVRMRIQPGEGATSSLDISRHAGDVLQFHSFYRDVRNQLAGVNGWVKDHESGSYQHVVGVPRRATAP